MSKKSKRAFKVAAWVIGSLLFLLLGAVIADTQGKERRRSRKATADRKQDQKKPAGKATRKDKLSRAQRRQEKEARNRKTAKRKTVSRPIPPPAPRVAQNDGLKTLTHPTGLAVKPRTIDSEDAKIVSVADEIIRYRRIIYPDGWINIQFSRAANRALWPASPEDCSRPVTKIIGDACIANIGMRFEPGGLWMRIPITDNLLDRSRSMIFRLQDVFDTLKAKATLQEEVDSPLMAPTTLTTARSQMIKVAP
jgi:hypothetical protein